MNAEDYKARVRARVENYSARLLSGRPQDRRWAEDQHEVAARSMTPRKTKRRANGTPLEKDERKVLRAWLKAKGVHFDENIEGSFKGKWARIAAKHDGMKRGRPDFEVRSVPPLAQWARGVAIELKRQKGGRVSREQTEKLSRLKDDGWAVRVALGAEDAIKWLESLGW